MIPVAWAVLCSDGQVHVNDDHSFLFLDKQQAQDSITGHGYWEDLADHSSCGPHRVVTLYRRGRQT